MRIQQIYQMYKTPPNVVRHMIEVAAVGRCLCRAWIGESVDVSLVTQALLLHDMGNIIKFSRPFLGELEHDAQYWEHIQRAFIKAYGNNVHDGTIAIVRELGIPKVTALLASMQEGSFVGYESLPNEVKICEYADCCVSPKGIVGFDERLADLMHRYKRKDEEHWTQTMRKNAQFVQQHVAIKLNELPRMDFSQDILLLEQYEVDCVSGAGFDPATATL